MDNDWHVRLEELLKNACLKALPEACEKPGVINTIEKIVQYTPLKNEMPANLLKSARTDLLSVIEPHFKKAIGLHTPSKESSLTFLDYLSLASLITVSFAGTGMAFQGTTGAIIGAITGFSATIILYQSDTEKKLNSKNRTNILKETKELPLVCWHEAIRSAYQHSLEETVKLLNNCMNEVFGAYAVSKKALLLSLISETAMLYAPEKQGEHIKEKLGKEVNETFDQNIQYEWLSNKLSINQCKAYTLISTAAGTTTGFRADNISLGVLSAAMCVGFLYCMHKAFTTYRRSKGQQKLLTHCFSKLTPDAYLNAFKHSIEKYRSFLEKHGAQEEIATILEERIE